MQKRDYSEVSILNLRSILYKFHRQGSGHSCNADLQRHLESFVTYWTSRCNPGDAYATNL